MIKRETNNASQSFCHLPAVAAGAGCAAAGTGIGTDDVFVVNDALALLGGAIVLLLTAVALATTELAAVIGGTPGGACAFALADCHWPCCSCCNRWCAC